MLILPHSPDFRLGRVPWVVISIALVCLVVYAIQDRRRDSDQEIIGAYCDSIYQESAGDDSEDPLRTDPYACASLLWLYHDLPDKETFAILLRRFANDDPDLAQTESELDATLRSVVSHYTRIPDLPPSLDARLMYDPRWPNPIRSLTSAIAHASWSHVIFNLIFFFAFATTIELIIGSTVRFLLCMAVIAFASDIAYSLTVWMGAAPLPSLGLSGVVMGMIGMAAFLMPNVRIRVLVWLVIYVRNFYIPAALLAVWYIGWDAFHLFTQGNQGGVNLVAHVFGGITGYLIARFWFAARRDELKDEIDDEVDHQRSQRNAGSLESFSRSARQREHTWRLEEGKRDFSDFVHHIHQAVRGQNDALAINLLLSRYDDYRHSIELYEEIYQELFKLPHTRALLCLSRLLIHEYLNARKYARALEVAKRAYATDHAFQFAEPSQEALLNTIAAQQNYPIR